MTSATFRSGPTWRGSTPCSSRRIRDLADFKDKGRHYTEEEKQWFLAKQRELVARVIPLHRELAARGQIELTTTPYYHPILPLTPRQDGGARGDARRGAAGLPRRLPG